jgi:hypothetical protein
MIICKDKHPIAPAYKRLANSKLPPGSVISLPRIADILSMLRSTDCNVADTIPVIGLFMGVAFDLEKSSMEKPLEIGC